MTYEFWFGLLVGAILMFVGMAAFGFYLDATNQMFITVPA